MICSNTKYIMCDSQYNDPHWGALASYSLGPANNGFYKDFQQSSPGMTTGMFIYSNPRSFTAMRHGHNCSLPYKGGIQDITPFAKKVANYRYIQPQLSRCTQQTYQPHACQKSALAQIYSAIENHVSHTAHPQGLSYDTGAPLGMAQVPPSGSGRCHQ